MKKHDELTVLITDRQQLRDLDVSTISIPGVERPENVIVLNVEGISMTDEHIFDGDMVLVQLFDEDESPKQGELIIAQYLASKDEYIFETDYLLEGTTIPEDLLEGPTIKYFYKQLDHVRLSIRKGYEDHPFTIRTKYIRSIGRVIGVYRSII